MKKRRWMYSAVVCALSACAAASRSPINTGEFAIGGVARVAGRITSSTGVPLDSVSVRIYLDAIGALYGTPEVFTDEKGEYQVDVTRLAVALDGDSLKVGAVAIIRIARLDTREAPGPMYRDSLVVTFFRPSIVPTITRFDYRVAKP
jgi:hypothetical protein